MSGFAVRALLAGAIAVTAAMAMQAQGAAPGKEETTVVRAWFDDPAQLRRVAPLLGHAQVDRAKGVMRTEADAYLRAQLIAAGFRVEIDTEASAALRHMLAAMDRSKSIPGYACYRTVEEAAARLDGFALSHPDLVEIVEIGESWEATQGSGGYPLRAIHLTNRALPGPKPTLFIMASVHAREYTPAELALRFVEELVETYGVDADATWILDHHEVRVVVHANPDGRKRAETGSSWRKNTNGVDGPCPSNPNLRGIDLNRNFPFEWGAHDGSSPVACDPTYRGPSPASEPETQALVAHVRNTFDDRRGPLLTDVAPLDTTGIFFDIHSFSELVLWPWGFDDIVAPNGTGLAVLGRRLAGFNDYTAEQAIGLYPTDGTTDDFAYGELGVPAYTFELGTDFFQDCATFESQILPDNRLALRYAARALRAPYVLPSGPDAFDARVEPDLILAGDPVTLRVQFDDQRQQTEVTGASGPVPTVQPIASARAYVGTPPWQPGAVAHLMQPADGSFNTSVEVAQASLPTAGLDDGKHLIYAQGRDSAGSDGLYTAAFVDVVTPEEAATLAGTVRDIGTAAPLGAEVRVGEYRTDSDPADGSYARLLRAGSYVVQVSAPGYETETLPALSVAGGDSLLRNFDLYRVCPVIQDAADVGAATPFTAQSPWQRRAGAGVGGSGAWLQSASGNYANNLNVSLTSAVLNLDGYSSVSLRFEQRCDTEAGYDYGNVEISTNGGSSWSTVFRCDGETSWRTVELALPQLDDQANARLRFRFTSDGGLSRPGWALDNIVLSAGSDTCRAGQVPQLRIDAFGATPAQISAGASTTLAWSTAHAAACSIGSSLGGAPIVLAPGELDSGSRSVAPAADATYTLSCSGNGGPATAQTSVDVVPVPQPVQISAFAAAPDAIIAGASSTLTWTTQNATGCSLGEQGGPATALEPGQLASGSRVVTPAQDTVFVLTCQGESGPVAAQAAVAVAPPVAIGSFSAAPATITLGESSTLAWSTDAAEACTLDDGSAAEPEALAAGELESGTRVVTPAADTTYRLICSGAAGPVQASTNVQVDAPLPTALFGDGFENAARR